MARQYKDPERVIKTVLSETGSMVPIEELRGFMRQALARGEALENAVERCFEGPGPSNATISQLERFRSAAEQLWAREADRFDPAADARIAALRDPTLSLLKRIADWIRSLDAREVDPADLPEEPMERLGEISGMLASVIEVINRSADDDAETIAGMGKTIGSLAPIVDDAIGAAEEALAEAALAEAAVAEGDAEPMERWVGSRPQPLSVFTLKIALSGVEPAVWRQVRVPGNLSLGDLHEVIQVAMAWADAHLHEFAVGDRRYANTMDVDDPECLDEETVRLDELGLTETTRFTYTYDFGDGWEHAIRVERMVDAGAFPPDERGAVVCVAGERATPPEDCGGVFGYMRLLAILSRPEESLDADDREFAELFGDGFDPEEFDIDAVNRVFRGEAKW